eukprot:1157685-Pelagomonas_calceolata.AAC.15
MRSLSRQSLAGSNKFADACTGFVPLQLAHCVSAPTAMRQPQSAGVMQNLVVHALGLREAEDSPLDSCLPPHHLQLTDMRLYRLTLSIYLRHFPHHLLHLTPDCCLAMSIYQRGHTLAKSLGGSGSFIGQGPQAIFWSSP